MAREASPIDVGSTWKFTDKWERTDYEKRNDITGFEVTGMYVDEDGETQVSVKYNGHDGTHLSVSAEDVRQKDLAEKVERTNAGHEAWERRQR